MRNRIRTLLLLAFITLLPRILLAQVTAGTAEGRLQDAAGQPVARATVVIRGGAGYRSTAQTDSGGAFAIVAPYGHYQLFLKGHEDQAASWVEVYIAPLQTTQITLTVGASGALQQVQQSANEIPGMWSDTTAGRLYPEGFSLQSLLVNRDPDSVTEPLDFMGVADNRLPLESRGALSWTDSQYKLNGMDATGAYQPGEAAILPDPQAMSDVLVRSEFAQVGSGSNGTDVSLFSAEPGTSWHGTLTTSDTGSPLTSGNLPPQGKRGIVQQNDQFLWFTRDSAEAGGPLTKWADLYASAAGQWASQTMPLASPGTDQGSQMLFADVRNRIRLGPGDQLDLLYSGSRVSLSNGGVPADIEDLMSRRMAPSFVLPGGFLNEAEADQFNFLQAGWTHELPATSKLGLIQVRYGYSIAHLDTTPSQSVAGQQSSIELLGGVVTGAPPLADLASQTRQEVQGAWTLEPLALGSTRHQIAVDAGWKTSSPTDRLTTPMDMNLITANGAAAFVVEFNTPLVTQELIRSATLSVTDHVSLTPGLSLDLGAFADLSRGSLPAQSSPAGSFAPARTFAPRPDLIAWNSLSPRATLAWVVPHAHNLVVRAGYFRVYSPLAGQYLDFGNPNSLGGSQYQWNDLNHDGQFEPGEQGELILRFGGPYSSISPTLLRPYADSVMFGAEMSLNHWGKASIMLYQRHDNHRLAALDTGIPAGAFTPTVVTDPDGLPGPRPITVFAQNPATFGQDRYLLTNPAGLGMFDEGIQIEMSKDWRSLTFHGSLITEETYGPTNPGNSVYENDEGVVGALLMDPNSTIYENARSFLDRAWEAKVQATYRLPPSWGGIAIASTATYLDGLAFGRMLLVTGLPQGPFMIDATRRGAAPSGGYRADYVLNWNLRLRRDFRLPTGTISGAVDVLNVLNLGSSIQENDLTSQTFFLRLPVAVQPPLNVRLELRYAF